MGETAQLTILEPYSLPLIYTEDRRDAHQSLRERGDAIAALRRGDELCVSHLHRLGTGQGDLSAAIRAVIEQGATVIEANTGRRSDNAAQLVGMIADANTFYARTMTPETAQRIGRLGAAASPMTKRRRDRMPIKDALKIVNDHKRYPTLVEALAVINKDKRYKRPWSVAHVYHLKKDGVRIEDRQ
jgi:hypothetical protein